jgi:hypothetical protein
MDGVVSYNVSRLGVPMLQLSTTWRFGTFIMWNNSRTRFAKKL